MFGYDQAGHAFRDVLGDRSPLQLLFLTLAVLSWLGGGNLVVALHYRRRGMSIWSGFRPFAFPFGELSNKEWLALMLCAVSSFGFFFLSVP